LLFSLIYSLLSLYSSRISRFVFSHLHLLCTSLCYSIVKDQFHAPAFFCGSLIIISQRFCFVNRFFKIFYQNFDFFLSIQSPLAALSVALATLNILPLSTLFVKCGF